VWRSRIDGDDGKTILIGTKWTHDDLNEQIENDPTFSVLKIAVADEMDRLICEYRGV